jgi:hypothetical protein
VHSAHIVNVNVSSTHAAHMPPHIKAPNTNKARTTGREAKGVREPAAARKAKANGNLRG